MDLYFSNTPDVVLTDDWRGIIEDKKNQIILQHRDALASKILDHFVKYPSEIEEVFDPSYRSSKTGRRVGSLIDAAKNLQKSKEALREEEMKIKKLSGEKKRLERKILDYQKDLLASKHNWLTNTGPCDESILLRLDNELKSGCECAIDLRSDRRSVSVRSEFTFEIGTGILGELEEYFADLETLQPTDALIRKERAAQNSFDEVISSLRKHGDELIENRRQLFTKTFIDKMQMDVELSTATQRRSSIAKVVITEYSKDDSKITEMVDTLSKSYDKKTAIDDIYIPSKLAEFREFYKYKNPPDDFLEFKEEFVAFEKEADILHLQPNEVPEVD